MAEITILPRTSFLQEPLICSHYNQIFDDVRFEYICVDCGVVLEKVICTDHKMHKSLRTEPNYELMSNHFHTRSPYLNWTYLGKAKEWEFRIKKECNQLQLTYAQINHIIFNFNQINEKGKIGVYYAILAILKECPAISLIYLIERFSDFQISFHRLLKLSAKFQIRIHRTNQFWMEYYLDCIRQDFKLEIFQYRTQISEMIQKLAITSGIHVLVIIYEIMKNEIPLKLYQIAEKFHHSKSCLYSALNRIKEGGLF